MAGSPFAPVLKGFARQKVRYVLIGVSGINYYSDDPGHRFVTQDLDVLVKPAAANLLAALKTLEKVGYEFQSNGEPVVGIDLELCRKIIDHRAVIVATITEEGLRIDLVLDGGGIPYEQWSPTAQEFREDGVRVSVGDLSLLIRAKENANREKDRKFLALYKIQLKEMLAKAQARRAKKKP